MTIPYKTIDTPVPLGHMRVLVLLPNGDSFLIDRLIDTKFTTPDGQPRPDLSVGFFYAATAMYDVCGRRWIYNKRYGELGYAPTPSDEYLRTHPLVTYEQLVKLGYMYKVEREQYSAAVYHMNVRSARQGMPQLIKLAIAAAQQALESICD